MFFEKVYSSRFSPRNGEVILKYEDSQEPVDTGKFQSPQWGSNSKVIL